MNRLNYFSLLFLAGSFIFSSCKTTTQVPDPKKKFVISDSLFKTIQIDSVTQSAMVDALNLTGQVAFNEDKVARIYPMVSGNIGGISVEPGDYVRKGQVLGVIQSAEMAGYGNDVVTSKTNLLIAGKNLDAAEDMFKSGLVSQKDLATTRELYKQAQAQLIRSTEVLRINGGNTAAKFVVRSPIDGFVVEKQVNNNMSIRPDNANDLFTISDLKDVWVYANVYESNISKVHLGDAVQITTLSYPNKIFYGKIDKILNVLDPTNKVMKVRVVLPNPGYLLKPQMFTSVSVVNKTNQESLSVPSGAIIFENSQYFILIYKSNSDVTITPVQLIGSNGGRSYITGPVRAGDKIIGSNAVLIYSALNS